MFSDKKFGVYKGFTVTTFKFFTGEKVPKMIFESL